MAQITTQSIAGGNSMSSSREIINNNFGLAADVINQIQLYLDMETLEFTGFEKASFYQGDKDTAVPTQILIDTNGSIRSLGNITAGGQLTVNYGQFSTGLIVTEGNIDISSSLTDFNLAGNMNIGGELVLKDFQVDGVIPAAQRSYFTNLASGGTSMLILDGVTPIGGWLTMKGRNGIVLNWETPEFNSLDALLDLYTIGLLTTDVLEGQVVEIVAMISDAATTAGSEFIISSDSVKHPEVTAPTKGIVFTKRYQSARLIYTNSNWVVTNLNGATYE